MHISIVRSILISEKMKFERKSMSLNLKQCGLKRWPLLSKSKQPHCQDMTTMMKKRTKQPKQVHG